MSFIPRLEELEKREMLAANAVESAAATFMSDAARFRNDLATSTLTLVNAIQSPPNAAANQMNQVENVLVADWNQMQQAFVQFESAVLQTYQQEFDALLADWVGYPTSQAPSPSPSPSPTGSSAGSGQGSGGKPPGGGIHPPSSSGNDPLYVLDLNTGETVPANVSLNTFSTWSENLLAQASGASSTTFAWNTSQAPDATNINGQNTTNLQWTWSSFTGPARTDTISVTETPQGGQPLTQTMTFVVAGTNSPAFSSSRPTTNSTWPTVITPDQISGGQATQSAGPYASIGEDDGSVQTSFSMPSYNPNATPISLDYNSTTANAQPIFLTEYQLPLGQSVPSTITAQLTFNNTPLTTLTYNTSSLAAGDIVQIGLQANATGLTTGRYPWSITVTNGSNQSTYSGNVNIVNQASSAFGAGWSLDNVEQLFPVTGGVILVEPGGTSLWFSGNGQGDFTSPAGDFSTMVQNQDGSYTRTMTDGTKINFNSSGQQTSTVDRDGNTTTFGYTNNLLTSITDMNGQVTTLTYTSGLLSSITDPANRSATLTYAGKQLTSITDPGSDVWQYAYDTANDLTTLTDPNNHATAFTYNFADRVSSVTQPDSSTLQLTPVQINGLAAPGTGTSSNPATSVLLATGSQALFTDGNGKVSTTGLDWLGFGQDVADIDPLGDASLNYINASNQVWMSSDALARRIREFYDSNGNPTEIVNPDDTYALYQYNSFAEPTKYTNEIGALTIYTYNLKGDLTQETNALNQTTTYAYNTAGLVTSMTNANNNTWTYSYDTLNRKTGESDPLKYTQSWVYDSASDLTQYTDQNGNVSTYAYNPMGWMTSETLPDISGVTSTSTYTYDKVGDQTSETIPITSALSATTTDTYDAMNRLSTETDPLNDVTTYTYDNNGNQIGVTNALGYTTTSTYDAANRQTGVTIPISGSDNQQVKAITTVSYDADGEQTSKTDALGDEWKTSYNNRGWVTSTTDPTGEQTFYGYDGVGDRTSETQVLVTGTGPSASYTYNPTLTTYDAIGETTQTTAPGGSSAGVVGSGSVSGSISGGLQSGDHLSGSFSGPFTSTTFYFSGSGTISGLNSSAFNGFMMGTVNGSFTGSFGSYNGTFSGTVNINGYSGTVSGTITNGNISGSFSGSNSSGSTISGTISGNFSNNSTSSLTTTNTYDSVGNLTGTSGVGGTMSYAYNADNEQTSMTDGGNDTTNYAYDGNGNQTSVTDPQGYTTTSTFDGQNRLLTTTDALSNVTSYAYNLAGWQISETDPDKNVTQYGYNNAGELTSETNPLNYQETFSYDAAAELTSQTDYNGQQIQYSYNEAGWKTGETWLNSQNQSIYQATYAYDKAGQLTSEQDPNSLYSYTYNASGDVTQDVVTYPGVSNSPLVTLNYTYDTVGNPTSLSDSLGGSLSYGYNGEGQLTGESFALNGITGPQLTLTYDSMERLSDITRTDGTGDTIKSGYGYDNASRLTNITYTDTTKSLALANYTYAYNSDSQISSYQDASNSLTYGYDKTGQLLSATGTLNGSNYSGNWMYDANGNRNMTGYQIGTGNQLLNDGTDTYTYDKNGNTLTKTNTATGDVWTYTWDYHNQMTEAVEKSKGGVVENDEKYTYDVEGRLIGVNVNGTQQRWTVFDGSNAYIDFNGTGTAVTERYVTSPGGYGTLFARVSGSGTANWYVTDNLGSIRLIVDTSGNVLDAIVYDPWGNIVSESNPSNGDRFKFAGGQYDSIQQTYLYSARWDNPQDARWETPDPLGLQPDSNPYRYVHNNPVANVDPSGMYETFADYVKSADVQGMTYTPPNPATFQDIPFTSYWTGPFGNLRLSEKEGTFKRFWVVMKVFPIGPGMKDAKTSFKFKFENVGELKIEGGAKFGSLSFSISLGQKTTKSEEASLDITVSTAQNQVKTVVYLMVYYEMKLDGKQKPFQEGLLTTYLTAVVFSKTLMGAPGGGGPGGGGAPGGGGGPGGGGRLRGM